jgi:hypothetical protein
MSVPRLRNDLCLFELLTFNFFSACVDFFSELQAFTGTEIQRRGRGERRVSQRREQDLFLPSANLRVLCVLCVKVFFCGAGSIPAAFGCGFAALGPLSETPPRAQIVFPNAAISFLRSPASRCLIR